ncbi:MAG: uracil-DNA glycosylase [Candidatus Gracilibacteria bacterium]|nr:uracil-DNA glycosylase [Candidatus Gracilibacteria bacterium]
MIELHPSWLKYLSGEFEKAYMNDIKAFLETEIATGKTIYPHPKNIFNALNTTHFDDVEVVIIGQDPYHGPGQAHGLSFSVQDGVRFPPSLKNIFKEVQADTGASIPETGNLTRWANQGVLLLNAVLTVEASTPTSHGNIGWQTFTDEIIKVISKEKTQVVFLLWGAYAQSKKELIDTSKHFVLEAPHPSPFSAHRGFLGCKHFSKTNEILRKQNRKEIEW